MQYVHKQKYAIATPPGYVGWDYIDYLSGDGISHD